MTYSESQVNDFLEQLLALRSSGPVYNPHVKNGQLRYRSCIPGKHQIVDHHNGTYNVTASDDTVMVGVHVTTGETKLFYPHELGHLNIIDKPVQEVSPATIDTHSKWLQHYAATNVLPGLGGIYSHHTNHFPYLVLGYANESARDSKRDDYPIIVVYVGQNGKVWAKTLDNFNATMNPGGNFQFANDAGFKYLGVIENNQIANGWMTKELEAAVKEATTSKDSDNDQQND